MSDITEEETIRIANAFLLSSPPGEFNEVVADVRTLIDNDSLLNNSAAHTFREYNTNQMVIVSPSEIDHKVLITKYGEVAEGEFLDPASKKVITFDHFKQEALEVRDASAEEIDTASESYRDALAKEVEEYADDHYPSGAGAVYGKTNDSNTELIVCLSSAKFNPGNFWNGRWRSVWKVSFSGAGSATLTGKFNVIVHYYEDGNVQLRSEMEKKVAVEISDEASTAQAIIAAVKTHEGAYQAALEEHYNTMSDSTFKQLRRKLPITKDKIDWAKMNGYKLAGDMQK
eukprot:GCRY01000560.1.p1 GENE.GCRY01000560.1~~GCRY01000560.1.p1  ORF type:complete len:286 (-),score=54.03 GCRY01000560.1:222-1079(-)